MRLKTYVLTFSFKAGGWLRGDFTEDDLKRWAQEEDLPEADSQTAWSRAVWSKIRENGADYIGAGSSLSLKVPISDIAGFTIEPKVGRYR